jgi:hypothetical protein
MVSAQPAQTVRFKLSDMLFYLRVLGALIIACGLALCHGALLLWPEGAFDTSPLSLTVAVLRIIGAVIAALLGVGNVIAGVVVLLRPARD